MHPQRSFRQIGRRPVKRSTTRNGESHVAGTARSADPNVLRRRSGTSPRTLFGNPRDTPRLPQADGLEIIEAAGPAGEARVLAERIKRLLLEGVAPDQIVIAVRGADDETDILRETLAAAGVPNAGTLRVPFSRMPVARTLPGAARNGA